MAIHARFVHTNLTGRDWRRLAAFYEGVFGCAPVPPVRSMSGRWLEEGTAVPGARAEGIHLRLPGHGDTGPTLEIYQFAPSETKPGTGANRPGFQHIAFHVDDVAAAQRAVLSAGGGELGRITTAEIPGAGVITFVYVTDPEGYIVELQRWAE